MIDSKLFQAIKASDLLGCQWQKDASSPLSIISTVREPSSAAHSLSLSPTHTHPSLQSQTPRAVALSPLRNRPSCSSSSRTSDRLILFRARVVFLALLSLSRHNPQRFDRVSNWVVSCLLHSPDTNARAALLSNFIRLLEHLISINNFTSSMAILGALNSACIQRLKSTWKVSLSLSHSSIHVSLSFLFGSLIGIFFHQSIDWIGLDWMLTMIRFPPNLSLSLSLTDTGSLIEDHEELPSMRGAVLATEQL